MPRRGFTLLEIVLAIGLAGAVLGLLATAIDLYLVRVDTSRTQVESAQLARTLLNQIASDLRAARYYSPAASSAESSDDSESGTEADADAMAEDSSLVQGIFGTATELRIDRSAKRQWEAAARQQEMAGEFDTALVEPDHDALPQTVRYILSDGRELLAAELAATGVSEDAAATGYAGLYREQSSTAAWMLENAENMILSNSIDTAELIAPEVVDLTFAYFDGEQLLTEWDSSLEEGLPTAVEIRLTLLKEPFEQALSRHQNELDELRRSKENLVEYRLIVKLPEIVEPQEAEFPQSSGQAESEDQNEQFPST